MEATLNQSVKAIVVDFGAGKYSAAMSELYKDLQRVFGLTPAVAEKVARQFGSDYGAAMASSKAEIGFGKKYNSDGKITLTESLKAKNVPATHSIRLAKACDWANQLRKGWIKGCKDIGVTFNEERWPNPYPLQIEATTINEWLLELQD